MQQTQITAYLAPKGFVNQAAAELKGVQAVHGRLVIADGPPQTSCWAQNLMGSGHANYLDML